MQRGARAPKREGNPKPGGLGCVVNTGLTNVCFWIYSNSWTYGGFFGSVANKGVSG